MPREYRSLENIIKDVMAKESVGVLGTDKFLGTPPAFNKQYKSGGGNSNQAATRGQSLQNRSQPYGGFEAEGGKKKVKEAIKPSIVPNQGDAPTVADLSARGCEQESGKKKKLKEYSDDNLDNLIKKGSLLNSNPLTKYTNPVDVLLPKAEEPKPLLKFDSANSSNANTSPNTDIQVPKISGAATTAASLAPIARTAVSRAATAAAPYALPAASDLAAGASRFIPYIGPAIAAGTLGYQAYQAYKNKDNNMTPMDLAPSNMVSQPSGLQKYTNPVPEVSSKIQSADKDYPAPTDSLQPHKFIGQQQATSPNAAGNNTLPKDGGGTAVTNSVAPSTSPIDIAKGVTNTKDHAKAQQNVIQLAQKAIERSKSTMNQATPSAVGVPSPAMTQTPRTATAPKTDADRPAPPLALPVPQGADVKAPPLPVVTPSPKDLLKNLPQTQTKPSTNSADSKDDAKDKDKEKDDSIPWAKVGIGAGALGALNWLIRKWREGSTDGKGSNKRGQFVYSPKGQIRGTPTRVKGQMKEETEADKERRDVEYVALKNKKRKGQEQGRQAAYKIVDETSRLAIMREAIKEKQDKEKAKSLKPGEHKTPVDVHPTMNPEPRDAVRS